MEASKSYKSQCSVKDVSSRQLYFFCSNSSMLCPEVNPFLSNKVKQKLKLIDLCFIIIYK
jgi:hypothetical protein